MLFRSGTHKAKERGEIKGSTKKIKRQKGTGTARAGSIKNPLFRGGGRIFGPRPRNYSIKLNKKVKKLARRSALADKALKGQVIVVEDFTFEAPGTKDYKNVLSALNVADKKTLLVTGDYNNIVYISSRNIPKASVMAVQDLNTYRVMNNNCLILTESSIDKMKALFV